MIPAHLSEVAAEIERGPQEIAAEHESHGPGTFVLRHETKREFATRIALMAAAAQAEQDAKICEGEAKESVTCHYAWQQGATMCAERIRAQALAQKQHD